MTDKQALKEAFTAGYKARELDTRKDSRVVEKIIDRKFKHFLRGQNHD